MRIVIAEDAAVIRAGLAEVLADRGHEVAAAVGDAEALKAAVAEHQPDVAIVDVRMPPDHTDEGLRAAIAIRRDHPGTGILVFSQYVETRYVADLLEHALRRSRLPAQGPGRQRQRVRRRDHPRRGRRYRVRPRGRQRDAERHPTRQHPGRADRAGA